MGRRRIGLERVRESLDGALDEIGVDFAVDHDLHGCVQPESELFPNHLEPLLARKSSGSWLTPEVPVLMSKYCTAAASRSPAVNTRLMRGLRMTSGVIQFQKPLALSTGCGCLLLTSGTRKTC